MVGLALLLAAGSICLTLRVVPGFWADWKEGNFPLSVSGEGTAYAVPDIATLNLAVRTNGTTLKDVASSNSQKNNQVIAFLKSKGVDEKDIKTIFYNVTPQYQYDNRPCLANGICPVQSPPRIVGYEVSISLAVKVRNLDSVGDILSGAVAAGANEVSGPNFTVDNEDKAKEDARALAIKNAKEKAEALAKAMGVRLIKISGFSESGDGGPIYYASKGMAMESVAPAVPVIQPGQNEVRVTVTLTFEVR
jgi:hypothetical protein